MTDLKTEVTFEDSDGSIYVLPFNPCPALDEDCRLDRMAENANGWNGQTQRVHCANGFSNKFPTMVGRCPFVAD